MLRLRVLASLLSCVPLGCAEAGDDDDAGNEDGPRPEDPEAVLEQAREQLPTYLDLHTTVIARTCSPDEGVCHHAKEYPDLTSAQAMLASVSAPCNVAVDDPLDMYNGCEPVGDEVRFPDYGPNENWGSEVAYTVIEDGELGSDVAIYLRDPVPNPMNDPNEGETVFVWRHYDDESVQMAPFYGAVSYEAGKNRVTIHALEEHNDNQQSLLTGGMILGDPNQDGTFGADEHTLALVEPGNPEGSYLLGRLLGTLPGTPMPLANQPLSSAEVMAMTCWIETLAPDEEPDVYQQIDYDNCQAAKDFGQGDPDSGHSLSQDVQPILDRCTAGGCHGDQAPAAELDLTAPSAYESLLRASTQDPATLLVTPGNPTNSYLMMKLRGTQVTGLQMPREAGGPGEPLPEEDLRVIEEWIIAGAPDD